MPTRSPVPARVAAGASRSSLGLGKEACQPSQQALLGCLGLVVGLVFTKHKATRQSLIPRHRALCQARALTHGTLARKRIWAGAGPQCPQLGPAVDWGRGLPSEAPWSTGWGQPWLKEHVRAPERFLPDSGSYFGLAQSQRFCWWPVSRYTRAGDVEPSEECLPSMPELLVRSPMLHKLGGWAHL